MANKNGNAQNFIKTKRRPKTIDINKVIELHNKGCSAKEISIELCCSVDTVYKKIRNYGNYLIYNELLKRGLILINK